MIKKKMMSILLEKRKSFRHFDSTNKFKKNMLIVSSKHYSHNRSWNIIENLKSFK